MKLIIFNLMLTLKTQCDAHHLEAWEKKCRLDFSSSCLTSVNMNSETLKCIIGRVVILALGDGQFQGMSEPLLTHLQWVLPRGGATILIW